MTSYGLRPSQRDKMEALEILEKKHGRVKEINAVEWRQWQNGLLEYVYNPTMRRVIWVVGEKEKEGMKFVQCLLQNQLEIYHTTGDDVLK